MPAALTAVIAGGGTQPIPLMTPAPVLAPRVAPKLRRSSKESVRATARALQPEVQSDIRKRRMLGERLSACAQVVEPDRNLEPLGATRGGT